jgi:hypothetical protein
MKKIVLLLLVLLSWCGGASAADWETTDTLLLSSALTMTAVDWAQTRYIARHPEYHEKNPALGSNPSVGKVDRYFGSAMIGTVGLAMLLPSTQRRWFLGGLLIVETAVVVNNHQIGIKAEF